uniref:USP domain-containing protein n=1 Tax=Haptolina ericina TaxID=156174 RepID=A0A7S3AJX4_9EUKA
MTAQRAILATLARLMLRSVRAAFGEEQQKLKREEAERAEQELLESLEAEDSKRDGNETKKKAKKKKRRTGAVDVGDDAGAGADGSALDAPTDGAFDDAAENALEGAICSSSTGGSCSSKLPETARVASVSTRMVLTDDNAPPGAYAGWDDAAAIVAAAQAAAESGRSAASAAGQAQLAPVVASAPAVPAGTASVTSTDGDEEDSAEREAREAAEALAVVEAEEAAEEAARLAELRKEQGSSVDTWEEVSSSRRRRKDRAPEPTGGAPAAEQAILGYAESISADAAARLERRRGRDGETAEAVAYVEADGALDGATATVTDAAAVEDGDRGDFGSKTRKKRSKEVKPRPPGNALDEPLIGAAEKEASLVDGLSGFTPSGGTGGVAAAVLSEGSSAAAPPSAEDILLPSLAMPSVVVDSEGAVGGGRERAGSGDCAKASAPGTEAPVSAPAGSRRNKRSKATEAGSVVGAAVSQTGSGAGVATSGGSASGQNGGCTGSGGGSSAGGARRKGKHAGAPASNSVDDGAAIGAPAAPGLENKTGQHSCFVNVVVQTLWNVSAFRDAFLTGQLHGDASEEDGSIYVAMKEVCSMMDDSANATAIADPHGKPRQATASGLKEALYRLDSNFELGEMHDATEAHEALLEALHRAVAPREAADERAGERVGVSSSAANGGDGGGGESRDGGGGSSHGVDSSGNGVKGNDAGGSSIEGSCGGGLGEEASTHAVVAAAAPGSSASFVKRIFAMRMRMDYAKPADPKEEQSKPLHFDQWTQYVVASELRDAVQKATNGGASPLVRVLRKEAGTEPVTEGGAVVLATRKLNMLEPPLVFTLGLSNDSARASKSQISESLEGIEETLNLKDVYDGVTDDAECRLVALTAFYESHYVCFCFSQAAGAWIHYDDETRREVGATFALVKDKCVAGRLHPQLCFYERHQP